MRTSRWTICLIIPLLSLLVWPLGCESTPSSEDLEAAKNRNPNFFVANRWIDEDGSGGAEFSEFQNANKWMFRSDEHITFVSRIETEIGATVTWQLHSPNGDVIDEGERLQRWESTIRRAYSGPVVDLLDQGGAGVWWVSWFINGTKVGESAANLLP